MLRTVELGRAVISATETTLELWLTALITLSPNQDCINFDQLNHPALFDLLTSGEVWVDQVENMQFVLDVSVRGEPIDRLKMRPLAERIVDAPVSSKNITHSKSADIHIRHGASSIFRQQSNCTSTIKAYTLTWVGRPTISMKGSRSAIASSPRLCLTTSLLLHSIQST